GTLCTITHASVLRPLIDYVLLATGGDADITICDVPLQSANWENLVSMGGYAELVDFYATRGILIRLADFRKQIAIMNRDNVIVRREPCPGDPRGYVAVDLGRSSALQPIMSHYRRLRITDYGSGTVARHHNPQHSEYLISRTILEADLLINVAKLKTHRKTGMTGAMKNLIGINGD